VDGGLAIENLEESGGTASRRFAPDAKTLKPTNYLRWPDGRAFILQSVVGASHPSSPPCRLCEKTRESATERDFAHCD
jgi:hypothetical protein